MTDHCPICLEILVDNIGVAVPCGHCFHRDCFDRLKNDSEKRTNDVLERALLQRCCICKKKVRKFHNLFLNFDPADKAVPPETSLREQQLQEAKEELTQRLDELQTLSSDQSEILCRLIPRHDHLEARYSEVKKEKQLLRRQLDSVEDENWDLRFTCFDAEAKLARTKAHGINVEMELEEAAGENRDLHDIWNSLDDQLEVAKMKRKSCKTKMMQKLREKSQELDTTKDEMKKMRQENVALQGQLSVFRLQISRLKDTKKNSKKKRRAKSKHRMQKINLIA